MSKIIGIYEIKNVSTGKSYLGSSKDINRRWSNHISTMRKGNHKCKEMQMDYDKFGINSFKFTVVVTCLVSELYIKEKYYLESFEPEELYNVKGIRKTTKKIRRGRESAAYTAKYRKLFSGENNPMCKKLNVEKVIDIKQMLLDGVSVDDIAQKYDISKGYVFNIKNGSRWESVQIGE